MSTPYGGNDPQQWGQQPGGYPGAPGGPSSGGFPAQGQEQWGQPQQPPPQWGQPGQPQYGQQPGGYPGGQPVQPVQPGQQYPGSGPMPQQQPGYPQQYGQDQWGQQQPPQQAQQWGQPQYGQQPGGYPPFPEQGGPQEKKKSSLPLWLGVGVLVLILGTVAFLGFVAPGFFNNTTFDSTQMESGVKGVLSNQYQVANVESVDCPDDQPVEAGHSFECTATIGGQAKKVQIKVVDDEGKYEVGKPA